MDERFQSMVVLGVQPGATADEIKTAYRDLARKWHPDKHQANPKMQRSAETKLREINCAYDYLIAHLEPISAGVATANNNRPAAPGYDFGGWKDSVAGRGRTEEWAEAEEEFYGRAIRLFLEGTEHFERARWRESVSCLLQSVFMVQDNAEAYRLLGRAYRRLMLPAKAESAYQQVLRIRSDDAETVYELGEVYVLLKDELSAQRQAAVLAEMDRELAVLLRQSIEEMAVANK